MEYASAVAGAAHSGVGNADHVAHAGFEQFFGNRQHAPLGHARSADGSCVLEDDDGVSRDVEGVVVDPCGEIVVIGEDDGGSGVGEKLGLHGGVFDDGATGGEVSVEDGSSALGGEGVITGPDDFGVEDCGS